MVNWLVLLHIPVMINILFKVIDKEVKILRYQMLNAIYTSEKNHPLTGHSNEPRINGFFVISPVE